VDRFSLEARVKAQAVGFSGRMAVYAHDLKGGRIQIDTQEEFETASCIKAFILAEFYRQVSDGLLDPNQYLEYTIENHVVGSGILRALDPGVKLTAKHFATLMIVISDNIATNVLIELLGLDNINRTCRDLGFANTTLHNKIDFTKYDRLGTTTPEDYGHFFEMVARGEMWSEDVSREMREIFLKQHYNRMLVKDLPQCYLDSENTGDEELFTIASKSGSMNACRNDGGIIHTPYGDYVLVIFTKEFHDPLYYNEHESYYWGARVSRLIFDHYLAKEGRF